MPELPEVETTLRGIAPHTMQQKISKIIVRQAALRWPVPANLDRELRDQTVNVLQRRAKYLLFKLDTGTLLLHLGMSGRLRLLTALTPPQKHDHIDIGFANGVILRFTDPRRFGALLWTTTDPDQHPLLAHIGPEPLSHHFNDKYLWERAQGKKLPVKSYIMDGRIVAGVGNIYATEALHQAGIYPQKPAGKVSREQYQQLVKKIQSVLRKAIAKGGTTLKDFMKSDGSPGYFSIELQAYGRGGQPCKRCKTTLKSVRIGQRSTVYCVKCQL